MSRPPDGLVVLRQTRWEIHYRGIQNPCGGTWGQLTHCRLAGVEFYVRENCLGRNMLMCSAARLGMKMMAKTNLSQVLDLLAPEEHWAAIAAEVRRLDGLGRGVMRNRRFTWRWARQQFERGDG